MRGTVVARALQRQRPLARATTPVAEALHAEWEAAPAILDHEPAAEHAAEVGEVRHPRGGLGDAEQQLQRREAEHEHARRHWNRRKQQDYAAVREIDAVGEEQPVDAARGPD